MPAERPLLPLLQQYFGFTAFRPLQEEIIRDALAGKDTFSVAEGDRANRGSEKMRES